MSAQTGSPGEHAHDCSYKLTAKLAVNQSYRVEQSYGKCIIDIFVFIPFLKCISAFIWHICICYMEWVKKSLCYCLKIVRRQTEFHTAAVCKS